MKIFAVRIGEKYGIEYERYLEKKLPYEIIWIREPYHPEVTLQWNKMFAMQSDIDEPVCVIDIDIILLNDYLDIFEYPIKRDQFLAMPGWWRDTETEGYSVNGGFFKYYPRDCRYIYDKFMSDIYYWQNFYIKNGTTRGPVNGEQFFVEDSVKERLELITLPDAWFTRWITNDLAKTYGTSHHRWQSEITGKYQQLTGNPYIYLGGEFYPDIRLVHFTNRNNKPHEWVDYEKHS
jgi:hypothetical protein